MARRLSTIRCRSGTVPLGSRVCCLARADTFTKLERRQGSARPHHQDGRPVYLRMLLVVGATSLIRRARYKPERADPRLVALLARKPVRLASVAMANKMARVVWAIMVRGETYQARHAPNLAGKVVKKTVLKAENSSSRSNAPRGCESDAM